MIITRNTISSFYIVLCLLLFSACSDSDNPGTNEDSKAQRVEIMLNSQQKEVMTKSYDFSINLYKAICESEEFKDKNFVVSPVAMQTNLSMLANGASGRTLQEILNILQPEHGEETTIETLNELNRKLLDELPGTDKKVKFALANSLWLSDGIQPLTFFKEQVGRYYDSALFSFERNTEAGKKAMNDWCSKATAGMVDVFFRSVPEDQIYLLSALFFQSDWAFPFNENDTKDEDFYCVNGEISKVPMMYQEFDGGVFADKCGMRVILDYGNGAYSMQLIKPDEGYSVSEAFTDIKKSQIYSRSIKLKLPRFSLETDAEFKEILASMGAENAFGLNGEYNALSSTGNLIFNHIRQNTKIEVDEKGTKVASVSSSSGGDLSAGPPPEVVEFYLDHPFGFLIMENSSCAVIAMGCINNLQ